METTQPVAQLPRLVAYHVLPDSVEMQQEFLQIVASLAGSSSEKFATDVARVARLNNASTGKVSGFQEFPGKGLGGLVELPGDHRPRAIVQGTRAFIQECGLQLPDILEVTARLWEKEPGVTIALVGWDGWVRGILKLSATTAVN